MYQTNRGLFLSKTLSLFLVDFKKLLGPLTVLSVFNLVAGLLLAARDLLMAWIFGVGIEVDAYFGAWMIPGFLLSIFISVVPSVLIPFLLKERCKNNEQDSYLTLFTISLVSSTLVLLIIYFFRSPLAQLIVRNYEIATLSTELLPLILIAQFFIIMCAFIRSSLHSYKNYVLPSILNNISLVVVISSLYLLNESLGIKSLLYGLIVAHAVEFCLLFFISSKRYNYFHIKIKWSPEIKGFIKEFSFLALSSVVLYFIIVVDQNMASALGKGSMSTLLFGLKVVNLFNFIIGSSLSLVFLVDYSELMSQKKYTLAYNRLKRVSLTVFLVGSVVALSIILLSQPLVKLLYLHGDFNPKDVLEVSKVQAMFALQIPFYLVSMIGVRFLNSNFLGSLNLKIVLVSFVFNILGNIILIKFFGISGIALSTSISYVVVSALVFYSCLRFIAKKQAL